MANNLKDVFSAYDYKNTEEYKHHLRTLERIDNMTPEEKFQTLVDAGIVSPQGELTQRYGGTAPNPEV